MAAPKLYMPAELAHLAPDGDTAEFWNFCRKRELRFQRCKQCGRFRHPPLPGCIDSGHLDFEWVRVNGKGTIYTYTIIPHPVMPVVADRVPYNVVIVEFPDAPGVRLISNLIDNPEKDIRIGMPVELVWEEVNDEVVLPRFRAAERNG